MLQHVWFAKISWWFSCLLVSYFSFHKYKAYLHAKVPDTLLTHNQCFHACDLEFKWYAHSTFHIPPFVCSAPAAAGSVSTPFSSFLSKSMFICAAAFVVVQTVVAVFVFLSRHKPTHSIKETSSNCCCCCCVDSYAPPFKSHCRFRFLNG